MRTPCDSVCDSARDLGRRARSLTVSGGRETNTPCRQSLNEQFYCDKGNGRGKRKREKGRYTELQRERGKEEEEKEVGKVSFFKKSRSCLHAGMKLS